MASRAILEIGPRFGGEVAIQARVGAANGDDDDDDDDDDADAFLEVLVLFLSSMCHKNLWFPDPTARCIKDCQFRTNSLSYTCW